MTDTVQDSALRVEMLILEEQADNAKARDLYWKPMAWLGAIRPIREKQPIFSYPKRYETDP